jgi:hypothetical protein
LYKKIYLHLGVTFSNLANSVKFYSTIQQPLVGQVFLNIGALQSDSLVTPQLVYLLWTSDQPDAETFTWQHNAHNKQTSVSPAEFHSTIPASERSQTDALEDAATGIAVQLSYLYSF